MSRSNLKETMGEPGEVLSAKAVIPFRGILVGPPHGHHRREPMSGINFKSILVALVGPIIVIAIYRFFTRGR